MKLLKLTPALIAFLFACNHDQKTFNYGDNPDKETFTRNRIKSYLRYSIIDSIVLSEEFFFDDHGNLIKRATIPPVQNNRAEYKYDSLDRLIYQFNSSDVTTHVWYSYEEFPKEMMIKKHVSVDSFHYELETLYYSEDLSKLVKQYFINDDTKDTVGFVTYQYLNGKIYREIDEDSIESRYNYDLKGNLISVQNFLEKHPTKNVFTNYYSSKTGLIDSSVDTNGRVYYYKYFYR